LCGAQPAFSTVVPLLFDMGTGTTPINPERFVIGCGMRKITRQTTG
jgi:hypothetical protein